ncbi:hypothetical protein OEZ60_20515 [Defluviimonas sp. WL0024]|uniref:Uncharacterized protein n=1 Tax=Albidovulum salinarum TaxID=2984153 RepID=A0ABT2XBF5_9RHOB|nr:hypothetical protein [Defluviimonas sp. WL0024]MCU9850372.1 hypothetical protein [Defluviimonas sp. WL0024]
MNMPNDPRRFDVATPARKSGEADDDRRLPSGWWLLPAIAIGLWIWIKLIRFVVGVFLDQWWA